MTDAYLPTQSQQPDGSIVLDYGEAHAARQHDAQRLLDDIACADSAVVMRVRCAKSHELARVYRTKPMVICIEPTTHRDADIRRISHQLGVKVTPGETTFCDILTASDDRDLEARCRCGRRELDRSELLEAIDSDLRLYIVK